MAICSGIVFFLPRVASESQVLSVDPDTCGFLSGFQDLAGCWQPPSGDLASPPVVKDVLTRCLLFLLFLVKRTHTGFPSYVFSYLTSPLFVFCDPFHLPGLVIPLACDYPDRPPEKILFFPPPPLPPSPDLLTKSAKGNPAQLVASSSLQHRP